MAIELYEHFERQDNLQADFTSGTVNLITSNTLSGSVSLSIQGGFSGYSVPASATKVSHFLWKPTNLAGADRIIQFNNGGLSTAMVWLSVNTGSGVLELRTSAGVVASSSTVVAVNNTYHLQFKAFIDNSVGILELKINNTIDGTFTGDTLTTAASTIDTIFFVSTGISVYDDLIVDTANYLGDARIKFFFPTANGNHTAWTGTYADVDERPNDGDTTKITSIVDGQKESFTYAAHGLETSAEIVAVCPEVVVKGSSASVKLGVRIGSTDYMETAQVVPVAYGLLNNIITIDPSDSNNWTLGDMVPETVVESEI